MAMGTRKFDRIHVVSKTMVMIDNHNFEAMTEDLSLCGVLIHTDHQIPVGKSASVSFNLPSVSRSTPVTIDGIVVRNNEQSVAFQFKSVDHDAFAFLKTVIDRNSPNRQKAYGNA
jgi:PilZ domain